MPETRGGREPAAHQPLRVGVTGGIASGKSAVAGVFADLGAVVIDTDAIAREVVEPGTRGLAHVVAAFGPQILGPDGRLDRKRLRSIVFADADARRRLERILHPLIRAAMNERSAAAEGPYQVLVIPLLVESGLATSVDRVLVVDCPENLQLERVMRRDRASEPEARAILKAQTSRAERLALADDVIVNDSDLGALERKVRELDVRYRELARTHARRS
jgi:dephospho-CoA kinase